MKKSCAGVRRRSPEKPKKRRPAALQSVDGLRPVGRFAYAQR
jgi:hypothetical protein